MENEVGPPMAASSVIVDNLSMIDKCVFSRFSSFFGNVTFGVPFDQLVKLSRLKSFSLR